MFASSRNTNGNYKHNETKTFIELQQELRDAIYMEIWLGHKKSEILSTKRSKLTFFKIGL